MVLVEPSVSESGSGLLKEQIAPMFPLTEKNSTMHFFIFRKTNSASHSASLYLPSNSTVAAARDAMGRRKEQDHSAELNAKADERAAGAEPARRIAERAQSGRAADAFRGVSGWAAEPQAKKASQIVS